MQKSWWSTKWLQSAQVLRLCIIVCMRKYAVFDFLWTHHRITCKYQDFGLWCVQRILLQEACGLFRYSFANLSCVTIFLFERKVFFSGQSFQTNHTCSIYFGVQKIELNWFLLRKEQQINKTSAFMVSDMLIVNYLSIFKYKHLAATYTTNFYGSSNGGTA